MIILSKILDWAKIVGKIEIFILDISTVVKNDNFEQNPWSGQHFWKSWNFYPRHACIGQKWQFWAKRIDRANILSKILDWAKVWKSWNYHPRYVCRSQKWQFWAKSLIGPTFLENLTFSDWTCPRWWKVTILSILGSIS